MNKNLRLFFLLSCFVIPATSILDSYKPIQAQQETNESKKLNSIIENAIEANFFFKRGKTKYSKKDYKGAIADLTIAIELQPSADEKPYVYRAFSKEKLRDYSGSISDLTKAIELEPNQNFFYKNRAELKSYLQDFKGACIDLKQAIELDGLKISDWYVDSSNKDWNCDKHLKQANYTIRKKPKWIDVYTDPKHGDKQQVNLNSIKKDKNEIITYKWRSSYYSGGWVVEKPNTWQFNCNTLEGRRVNKDVNKIKQWNNVKQNENELTHIDLYLYQNHCK